MITPSLFGHHYHLFIYSFLFFFFLFFFWFLASSINNIMNRSVDEGNPLRVCGGGRSLSKTFGTPKTTAFFFFVFFSYRFSLLKMFCLFVFISLDEAAKRVPPRLSEIKRKTKKQKTEPRGGKPTFDCDWATFDTVYERFSPSRKEKWNEP